MADPEPPPTPAVPAPGDHDTEGCDAEDIANEELSPDRSGPTEFGDAVDG